MCGIIGYVGGRPCRELILTGLERLEYRGYDSAGFALIDEGHGVVESVRAVGNLAELRAAAGEGNGNGATAGVGHTRWATHGRVTDRERPPARERRRLGPGGHERDHRELPGAADRAPERRRGRSPRTPTPRWSRS